MLITDDMWVILLCYTIGTLTGVFITFKFFMTLGAATFLEFLKMNGYVKYTSDSEGRINFIKHGSME